MITVALVLAMAVTTLLAADLIVTIVETIHRPHTPFTHDRIVDVLSTLLAAAVTGWAAAKVSYRWRDGLFQFVPLYGIYWTFRIAWRIAYLPYRDWTPRDDETAGWRQVIHPTAPGALLYVAPRDQRDDAAAGHPPNSAAQDIP